MRVCRNVRNLNIVRVNASRNRGERWRQLGKVPGNLLRHPDFLEPVPRPRKLFKHIPNTSRLPVFANRDDTLPLWIHIVRGVDSSQEIGHSLATMDLSRALVAVLGIKLRVPPILKHFEVGELKHFEVGEEGRIKILEVRTCPRIGTPQSEFPSSERPNRSKSTSRFHQDCFPAPSRRR